MDLSELSQRKQEVQLIWFTWHIWLYSSGCVLINIHLYMHASLCFYSKCVFKLIQTLINLLILIYVLSPNFSLIFLTNSHFHGKSNKSRCLFRHHPPKIFSKKIKEVQKQCLFFPNWITSDIIWKGRQFVNYKCTTVKFILEDL